MAKYKVGEKVFLNSGGPEMTIVEIITIMGINYACAWFDKNNKPGHGTYPEEALTKTPPKGPKDKGAGSVGVVRSRKL